MPTITTKGKHKRGDRGSTEEEANSSKRANMAAELNSSEDNPILEDEERLTVYYLHSSRIFVKTTADCR